jgi:hypothetical protein
MCSPLSSTIVPDVPGDPNNVQTPPSSTTEPCSTDENEPSLTTDPNTNTNPNSNPPSTTDKVVVTNNPTNSVSTVEKIPEEVVEMIKESHRKLNDLLSRTQNAAQITSDSAPEDYKVSMTIDGVLDIIDAMSSIVTNW